MNHDYKQTGIAEWSDDFTCQKCGRELTYAAEDCVTVSWLNEADTFPCEEKEPAPSEPNWDDPDVRCGGKDCDGNCCQPDPSDDLLHDRPVAPSKAVPEKSVRNPAPREAKDAARHALYEELLYAVGSKWPNEYRHQTALRYIQQAEAERQPTKAKEQP